MRNSRRAAHVAAMATATYITCWGPNRLAGAESCTLAWVLMTVEGGIHGTAIA